MTAEWDELSHRVVGKRGSTESASAMDRWGFTGEEVADVSLHLTDSFGEQGQVQC